MRPLKGADLVLRFLLELCALAAGQLLLGVILAVVADLNGLLLHLWGLDTGDPHF